MHAIPISAMTINRREPFFLDSMGFKKFADHACDAVHANFELRAKSLPQYLRFSNPTTAMRRSGADRTVRDSWRGMQRANDGDCDDNEHDHNVTTKPPEQDANPKRQRTAAKAGLPLCRHNLIGLQQRQ